MCARRRETTNRTPTYPTHPPIHPSHTGAHVDSGRMGPRKRESERHSAKTYEAAPSRAERHLWLPASGRRRDNRPPNSCRRRGESGPLAAANVTLVNGDAAAVSITVHQRILSPASLVGTHAAASDHFPHAEPI